MGGAAAETRLGWQHSSMSHNACLAAGGLDSSGKAKSACSVASSFATSYCSCSYCVPAVDAQTSHASSSHSSASHRGAWKSSITSFSRLFRSAYLPELHTSA